MVLAAILLYDLANTVPICCRFFCRIFQCYYITVFTPSTRSQYATVLACCFDLGNTGLLCCRFFCCIFHGHYASVLTAVLPWSIRQGIVWCICWCIGWYHRGFPWLGRRTTTALLKYNPFVSLFRDQDMRPFSSSPACEQNSPPSKGSLQLR